MIDLDRMEAQLAAALNVPVGPSARPSPAPPPPSAARSAPAPAPTPAPAPEPRRRAPAHAPARSASAPELLELGLIDEADAAVAAAHPRDLLTWTTMRALLDGRRDAVRNGIEELRGLAGRTDDAEAWNRYWTQRFWAAFEWGGEEERFDVLDHCRNRAYRFDDLQWWGNLALLLAAMGKHEEAAGAFDDALRLAAPAPDGTVRLDVLTNLVEAGALLGDPGRVAEAARHLRVVVGRLVVVGDGVVCKGSIDRYLGLAHAALGRWDDAGRCFRSAEATHRSIGAQPLLVRTVQQASGALVAA